MPRTLRSLRAATDIDATTAESRAAALQYVRLVTGTARPHPDDRAEFEALVLEIARATERLQRLADGRRDGSVGIPSAV